MQPTLVICASQPGILYLNGLFSGEISPDEPLIRPVSPRGAVYMDFRPLENGYLPVTRKIVFSGGKPMGESVERAEDIGAVLWPGGICEIEITPPVSATQDIRRFSFGGHTFSISGEIPKLYCGRHLLGTLPEGASIPKVIKMQEGYVFSGESGGSKYLLTADKALKNGTGFLSADEIEIGDDETITAKLKEKDIAGHATIEKWRLSAEGLELVSSEQGWEDETAKHPQSAEETAIAAVQAALLGKTDEALEYLHEDLRDKNPLDNLFGKYDLCTQMKYAHPDNKPCIALIRLENERLAVAEPLYYGCVHNDGQYLIDRFYLSPDHLPLAVKI